MGQVRHHNVLLPNISNGGLNFVADLQHDFFLEPLAPLELDLDVNRHVIHHHRHDVHEHEHAHLEDVKPPHLRVREAMMDV